VHCTAGARPRGFAGTTQYDVGAGGALTAKATPRVPAGTGPNRIAVSSDGRSVYVADGGSDDVAQYDVGAGGRPAGRHPPPSSGTAPAWALNDRGRGLEVRTARIPRRKSL
jgi:DNA-binding beta-propeller fold protein YncE